MTSMLEVSSSPIVQLPEFAGTSTEIVEFCNFGFLEFWGLAIQ